MLGIEPVFVSHEPDRRNEVRVGSDATNFAPPVTSDEPASGSKRPEARLLGAWWPRVAPRPRRAVPVGWDSESESDRLPQRSSSESVPQ